jgi:octaprenyl-diphosphate synthase
MSGEQHQQPDDFERARALLAKHDAIERTLRAARDYAATAKAELAGLPSNVFRDALARLADFVVDRNG